MNQPPLNPDEIRAAALANRHAILDEEFWGFSSESDAQDYGFEQGAKWAAQRLAAALPEVTSVEAIPGEKLAAQIILRVDVMLGFDPGTNTPNAFELPYEYLVIRGAEVLKSEAIIQSGIFQVVGEGVFDDADPDSVLVEAVTHGLSSLATASPEVKP